MKNKDVKDILYNSHTQFLKGYNSAGDAGSQYASMNFERIVTIGVGGSGFMGDLLKNLSAEIDNPLPVVIHKDYGLPIKPLREKALIIINSYSGNTKEVLDSYNGASVLKLPLVVMSTGGQLTKRAQKESLPIALISQKEDIPPRFSTGYQVGALMKILENARIIPSQENNLAELEKELEEFSHTAQIQGKQMANMMDSMATPLIFASSKYSSVADIIKGLINENADNLAFSGTFPNLNHNILMGYGKIVQEHFHTIILKSSDDDLRIQQRADLTTKTIQEQKGPVTLINLEGNNVYSKIFKTTTMGAWFASYLAEQKNVNPITIPILVKFKNKAP